MATMTTMQQQREQQRENLQRQRDQEASFQHTQLGVYLAGAFGLMYLWASSAQVRGTAVFYGFKVAQGFRRPAVGFCSCDRSGPVQV